MSKLRLDVLLFERGLAHSRELAKSLIMSGNVFIEGDRATKPGVQVCADASVEVRKGPQYVSRGGQKLEKALSFFSVSPKDRVCIDCGASTGGFTDCLLKNDARLVYAIDVGYGQLAWTIRNDPRVIAMERTNIRNVTVDMLDFIPSLATIDVSFISLSIVLPIVFDLLTDDAQVLCLIKPQFEAGRELVGKKGVVRDPEIHKAVLDAFVVYAGQSGFFPQGLTYSPLRGPEGNIEFLALISTQGSSVQIDTKSVVREAHEQLQK